MPRAGIAALVTRERVGTALLVLFLAWFSAISHDDNSNGTEIESFAQSLYSAIGEHRIPVADGGSLLSGYLAYPTFELIRRAGSGAYLLRGYTVFRGLEYLLLYICTAVYFGSLGIRWPGRTLGLGMLAWALVFVEQVHGWGFQGLTEAILLVCAAIAALHRWTAWVILLGALAVLNKETGFLVVLLPIAAHPELAATRRNRIRWAILLLLAIAVEVAIRLTLAHGIALDPDAVAPGWQSVGRNLEWRSIISLVSGFALTPLLALAWLSGAPGFLRRLVGWLVPPWLCLELVIQPAYNGRSLIALVPLVFLPICLLATQRYAIQTRGAGG